MFDSNRSNPIQLRALERFHIETNWRLWSEPKRVAIGPVRRAGHEHSPLERVGVDEVAVEPGQIVAAEDPHLWSAARPSRRDQVVVPVAIHISRCDAHA